MNKKYVTLIKDTLIFAIGGIGSKMILFFLVPLYTNFMTPDEYGISDLVFTISQFVIPFVSVVIFDAVLRFGLSKTEKKEDVLVSALTVFGIGGILTVCLTPLLQFYSAIARWKWYICIYIILNILLSIELNYIKTKNKNRLYAIVSIIQTLVMAIANILLLAIFKMGIKGYIIANITGIALAVVLVFIFGKLLPDIQKGKLSRRLITEMVGYSAPLILNNISWWFIQSSSKLMIELMISEAMLGIYTVATKIPSLINVFISIFSQSWGLSSVRDFEEEKDTSFYSNVFNFLTMIAFAMSIGLILIIKPFMSMYVGKDFIEAWRYVPMLLMSASFSAIASYFGSIYGALKKTVNNMLSTLVSAIVSVGVTYFGIIYFGLWGAIFGTLVAYLVLAFYRMFGILRFVKIKIKWVTFFSNVIILGVEVVMVSLGISVYLVPAICLCLFLLVNFKTIKSILFKKKG